MTANKVLNGIGASSGIGIAKSFIINQPHFNVEKQQNSNVQQEMDTYKNALEKTKEQISKTKQIALAKLGSNHAAVFDAHLEILQDISINDEINGLIQADKLTAAYATFATYGKYMQMFKEMEDEYFKLRALDLKDVSDQLLSNLLNINLPNLLTINEPVIIVAHDLSPSQTTLLDKQFVKGFLTDIGGKTSHAAILARSLGIPAILGLKDITTSVAVNDLIAMDGFNGVVVINPKDIDEWEKKSKKYELEKIDLAKYADIETKTLDNKRVLVEMNIGSISDFAEVSHDGIGLLRSEFLYMQNSHWPTLEEQFDAYKQVVDKANGKLVIVRTLDIGGDKTLSYYKFPKEDNPFLGYRAIRFCLDNAEIFKTQLKALLKASAFGKVGIMFPMIGSVEELDNAIAILNETKAELRQEKTNFDENVLIGMMIEIPSTCLLIEHFTKRVDFFSIGTNDLVQYTFAADRMSEKVAYLYQPNNPAILKLIEFAITTAKKHNKIIAMCGEMASDPLSIPILVGLGGYGLDAFSMNSNSMFKAKKIICNLKHSECVELAKKAITLQSASEVNNLVRNFLEQKDLI